MIVRYAKPADRMALADMSAAMAAELTPHLRWNGARAHKTFDDYLAKADPTIFVAETNGTLVGFLLVRAYEYCACDGFYVQQDIFYVRPENRGSRAAAALFARFIRWAREMQPEEVYAGIAYGRRSAAAARWLGRFGFEPTGQQYMRLRIGA